MTNILEVKREERSKTEELTHKYSPCRILKQLLVESQIRTSTQEMPRGLSTSRMTNMPLMDLNFFVFTINQNLSTLYVSPPCFSLFFLFSFREQRLAVGEIHSPHFQNSLISCNLGHAMHPNILSDQH